MDPIPIKSPCISLQWLTVPNCYKYLCKSYGFLFLFLSFPFFFTWRGREGIFLTTFKMSLKCTVRVHYGHKTRTLLYFCWNTLPKCQLYMKTIHLIYHPFGPPVNHLYAPMNWPVTSILRNQIKPPPNTWT